MLPLELTFKDYNRTEKISYLPRKLSVQGSPSSCTPEAGAFTYGENLLCKFNNL